MSYGQFQMLYESRLTRSMLAATWTPALWVQTNRPNFLKGTVDALGMPQHETQ